MAEYSTKEREWIWLSSIKGMTPTIFNKLINYYQDIGYCISSLPNDIDKLNFIGANLRENILQSLTPKYIDRLIEIMDKLDITAITMMDKKYPTILKHIYDPPTTLYCKGNVSLMTHNRPLGIIGSRTPTYYGETMAHKVAAQLAENNVCIVSGMAMGIDAKAHSGALSKRGDTIAVLGCGVDICYPSCNQNLYKQIAESGLIVSEYPPSVPPLRYHFPARNRIISGLSKGILVVEASKTSGTNRTIDHAQDQGRDVLAIPGNVTSDKSYTPNNLIREGCTVVLDYRDIMDWFGWRTTTKAKDRSIFLDGMDIQEKTVYNTINDTGSKFDELQFMLDYSPTQLLSLLAKLEIKGYITKLPGNRYARS